MKVIKYTIFGIGAFTWLMLLVLVIIYVSTAVFNGALPKYGDAQPQSIEFLGPVFGLMAVVTIVMLPVQTVLVLMLAIRKNKSYRKSILVGMSGYGLIITGILIVLLFDPVGFKDWFLD